MEPLVSVIIPVYNVKMYLDQCIQSILSQEYKNLEIILVDDGSEDGSAQVCDQYALQDSRFLVHHQPNAGVSAARNWALDAMHGEYVLFVDADDFIDSKLVLFCVQTSLEENSDIVVFKYSECKHGGKKIFCRNEKATIDFTYHTKDIFKQILCNKISNMVWIGFYKASLWKYTRFLQLRAYEDLYICPLVFSQSKKSIQLNNTLYYYNKGNTNSLTGSTYTYNSQYRYYKYLAYQEHLRWAQKIGDMDVIHWAKYHMMYEAIKILYVDYYSSEKLCVNDKKCLIQFVTKSWTLMIKKQIGLKHRFWRWAFLYCPIFCKGYSLIRYQQERMKQKI